VFDFLQEGTVNIRRKSQTKRSIFSMRRAASRARGAATRFAGDRSGQSLLEVSLMVPLFTLMLAYAIDFGYFFIVAANLTSAARNAAEYSVQGYQSAAQTSVPAAGPVSTATSVSALAIAGLSSLVKSSTTAAVQVCSKSIGTNGNLTKCSNYGATGATYTPATDPEAPHFYLQRVDVTYTVQPPIPLTFFKVSLLPTLAFHRQVSMRAMD
jgi:Flp pilus assembly protein TadG